MSISQGNKFSNYRYNPITGSEVAETVTGELSTCAELTPELPGVYGFELLEVPQASPPGITSIVRTSGGISFSYVATNPGANQYYIDYTNNSPVVIVNSANNGMTFTTAYNSVGAPDSVYNSRQIEASTRGIIGAIRANRVTDSSIAVDTTKTISAKHASVRNLTVATTKTLTVDQALEGLGVLHVYGDLTLSGTAILSLKRTLLIVYGDIFGTGTIQCPKNPANGGDGNGAIPGAGAGVNGLTEYGGLGATGRVSTYGGECGTLMGGGGAGGLDNAAAAVAGQNATSADANIGSGGGGAGATGAAAGGAGGEVISGDYDGTYVIGKGGAGGATGTGGAGGGGGAGGYPLNIICFGSIATTITLRSGLPGEGGNCAFGLLSDFVGNGGYTGNLNLWSQYTSAPCTVLVTKGTTYGNARDGSDGTANYYPLDASSMFGILNAITKNQNNVLTHANQLGWLFWTKSGVAW